MNAQNKIRIQQIFQKKESSQTQQNYAKKYSQKDLLANLEFIQAKSLFIRNFVYWSYFFNSILLFIYKSMIYNDSQVPNTDNTNTLMHQTRRRQFGYTLFVFEVIVILVLGIFYQYKTDTSNNQLRAAYYFQQDANVMMLIGFGFLNAFVFSQQWSGLSYNYLAHALIVQSYFIFNPLWQRVFHGGWDNLSNQLHIIKINGSLYCVATLLTSLGAVLGRVGPLQVFIHIVNGVFFYTINEDICFGIFKISDVGGSITTHIYGTYYGLAVSSVISRVAAPSTDFIPKATKFSNTITLLGGLFIWALWPSFNTAYFTFTPFWQSMIIQNTIYALCGSCLVTFVYHSMTGQRYTVEKFMQSSLVGGVAIGAPCCITMSPLGCIIIGILAGLAAIFGFKILSPKLKSFFGLYDECGINNTHGLPGIMGGVSSAIIFTVFNAQPPAPEYYNLVPQSPIFTNLTYNQLAAYQVAAIFVTLGISIGGGFVGGCIISYFYEYTSAQFYQDIHFDKPIEEVSETVMMTILQGQVASKEKILE